MSLARTALRLAAIQALNTDPLIGVLCGGRIYDSRITALDGKEPKPVITVYTEDDQGEGFSANNGGEPFDRTCDLVIEIALTALGPSLDENGDPVLDDAGRPAPPTLYHPVTDAELESALDLLDDRVVEALTVGETPASRLIRTVVRRFPRVRSSRYPTDESGERLAIRLVTLSAEMKVAEVDASNPPDGPYATLPDPLRTVCQGLPSGAHGELICQLLAATLTTPSNLPFHGVDLTLHPRQELRSDGPPSQVEPNGSPLIRDHTHVVPGA
jgi:hypothetical protein